VVKTAIDMRVVESGARRRKHGTTKSQILDALGDGDRTPSDWPWHRTMAAETVRGIEQTHRKCRAKRPEPGASHPAALLAPRL